MSHEAASEISGFRRVLGPWHLSFLGVGGIAGANAAAGKANVAYVITLPVQGSLEASDVLGRGVQYAQFDRVGTAAAEMIFGAPAAVIMAAMIMISTFGCCNGRILAGASVYYPIAKDELFFKVTGKLNRKSVPLTALAVQTV